MNILIDIGHPAHIHYFKNCARILTEKGFKFLFVVRERDSTIELIQQLGFDYVSRGEGHSGLANKLLGIPVIDHKLHQIAKSFKPDLFLSFASPYAAHVSSLMRKPHISFDDTEHAKLGQWMYRPFTDTILSPSCYNGKLWRHQLLFDSYMEMAYLVPKYFKPDRTVLGRIGVAEGEKYCVLRLVSWDANHDVGQAGLSYNDKVQIVKELSAKCRVFISCEKGLDASLKQYQLRIHPSDLHNVLHYASLYIGEGGTTATESVVLGTPAIYTNSLNAGIFEDEQKRGLLFRPANLAELLDTANMILEDESFGLNFRKNWEQLLNSKIDATAFMVWFIENYPESKRIMETNPDYQYHFK